jgi:Kdo2-lipid IVA lauroyltransferase/acyltransferase
MCCTSGIRVVVARDARHRSSDVEFSIMLKIRAVSAAVLCLRGLSMIPKTLSYWLGAFIGVITLFVSKRRRNVAQRNLQACFPNMTKAGRALLLVRVFIESGIGLLESSWVWFRKPSNLRLSVSVEGAEIIESHQKAGRGVLLLCPHYTTLELSAPIINQAVGRFVITYRPQAKKYLENIIRSGRSVYGDLLNVRDLRSIVSALRKGRVVWFGPDQDMGPRGSVFADFFGVPACTVTTPSRLARATNCAVVFCKLSRKRGRYRLIFEPMGDEYPYPAEIVNARKLNQLIETALESNPAQYMWIHRRFKTNPDGTRHGFYD